MNGVRSTFMRRGYLLTALAALLLAASAGTASAQSVEFGVTTAEVLEGSATGGVTDPAPLRVTVTRSPRPTLPIPDNVGTVTLAMSPTLASVGVTIVQVDPTDGIDTATLSDNTIVFPASSNEATLIITQAEDNDWNSETLTLSLRANAGASIGPNLVLTMVDNEAQPIADFDPNPVMLHEGSETDVLLTVDVPMGTSTAARPSTALNALSEVGDELVMSVSPAGAIGTAAEQCGARNTPNVVAWSTEVAAHRNGISTLEATRIAALHPGAATPGAEDSDVPAITLTACADMKGFQDTSITLTVIGTTSSSRRGLTIRDAAGLVGTIGTGSPLVINIDSDEEVPTLSFSPTDVEIAEGESTMTRLIAEGKYGAEVGMVKLMVEGDAMVDLYQDGEMLEEMGGYVMVDLGDSNTAELMAMSMESRELQDGDMAYKAWKLVEGETDGAHIGEGSWFRVDVVGSTAVPALPLIGQLLLALFLMAGGSRLYRRRRG